MWMNWLWMSVWTSVSVLVFCYNLSPHSSNLVTELWLFVHSMSASGSVCAESVCNWCGVQAFSTQAGWTCNCDLRSICNLTTPWGLVVCDIHTQYSTVPDYHLSIQGEKTQTLYIIGLLWPVVEWAQGYIISTIISTSAMLIYDDD